MSLSTLTPTRSLKFVCPELEKEWDYDVNFPLTPCDVTFDDYKERGWICEKCGNKWLSRVSQRYMGMGKCLKCISIGKKNPELCKEWDYKKNLPLTIFDVTSGSHKRAYWICSICNHKWSSTIKNRCNGCGCPSCGYKKLSFIKRKPNNENSLEAKNKTIASQWHPTKNGKLSSKDVYPNSVQEVWWRCLSCGCEWKSTVALRFNSKYKNCPNSPMPISKNQTLSFLNPEMASEFYISKNPHINPNNISMGSRWIIKWKCSKCGCLWDTDVNSRNRGCNNCPKCSKKIILKNGVKCSSLVEAYYYLKYRLEKIKFLHNKKYSKHSKHSKHSKLGNCRYDFYIIDEQTYVEITSFHKGFKKWFSYLRRIAKKKHFVENILGKKFIFIQEFLTPKQIKFVNDNRKY